MEGILYGALLCRDAFGGGSCGVLQGLEKIFFRESDERKGVGIVTMSGPRAVNSN